MLRFGPLSNGDHDAASAPSLWNAHTILNGKEKLEAGYWSTRVRRRVAKMTLNPLKGLRSRRDRRREQEWALGLSGRPRCKPHNREFRCEAAAGRSSKNGKKWDGALEPGWSSRRCLLACGAGVHVDFHANRHLNDLRCFPGHQRTPSPRHGCRINMVRPHRKWRKPASSSLVQAGEGQA
jgi:hypothetical protein